MMGLARGSPPVAAGGAAGAGGGAEAAAGAEPVATGTGAAAAATAEGEPGVRRKPQDPQKRLPGPFMWPHCGHGDLLATTAATAPLLPAEGLAAGAATGAAGADGAAAGGAAAAEAMAEAEAAFTPCGGVWGENAFGAESRGSSAPQPRQNL